MKYIFGLLGYPLHHSLSPCLHRQFLQACGLQGEYQLFPVAPQDIPGLQARLQDLRSGLLQGLNVTIPHKQTLLPFLDDLTPEARAIGAVNTILLREGRLLGENTDAPAFAQTLEEYFPEPSGADFRFAEQANPSRRALVLGAGGAARAVILALRQRSWQVSVFSRRPEQAQALASPFEVSAITARPVADDFDLLVNATPAGMFPALQGCPWPEDWGDLPACSLVYDLIYNPAETLLLRRARLQGLPTLNGWPMLSRQAALAFTRWTGLTPPLKGLSPC